MEFFYVTNLMKSSGFANFTLILTIKLVTTREKTYNKHDIYRK